MSELASILAGARALRRSRDALLLATVVRVRGSAYRRPGARLVATDGATVAGSVSGGCLERDIVRRGAWRTREAPAVLVTYDGAADDEAREGLGVGCDGVVDVLVERIEEGAACDPIAAIARVVDDEQSLGMATVFASSAPGVPVGGRVVVRPAGESASTVDSPPLRRALGEAARRALAEGTTCVWSSADRRVEALVEALRPAPHLFVFGGGQDAVPVVALAKALGWGVSVCEPRARLATRRRFAAADHVLAVAPDDVAATLARRARPLAVVLSHDYAYDRAAVRGLAASSALYVGVLGPRRRAERILADIEADGGPAARDVRPRLHAPAGLDLGAEEPAEIALAIVAEAQAALTAASALPLRERRGAIHGGDGAMGSAAE